MTSVSMESADPSSPAETAPRAVLPPAARGDNSARFDGQGTEFSAFNACVTWLKARGFSVGPLQGNSPVAVMFGDVPVKSWKFQSAEDLNDLHAKIMPSTLSANMRGGPVTVYLRSMVHSDVAAAFRSDPVDTAARQCVEGASG